MFTDRAVIFIKSGNGGHGAVAFHREKYIAAGGPDGGDGGNGGSIVFKVDTGMTTLADFRYKRKYVAENGGDGSKNKMTGKNGSDLIVKVPQGTIVKDNRTGLILADLVEKDECRIIAKGGKGGKGNYHYATATRQIPNFARAGSAGVELEVVLELKLLADVGLVGFPNVGKSTLLSVTTSARPEIADYPFTTMNPQLGVCKCDGEKSFVMADIPGLIEGAGEGRGVGHRFLRHIERTRLLLHIIDMSGSELREPFEDFLQINEELKIYNEALVKRPQLIVANKMDIEGAAEKLEIFKEKFGKWLDEAGKNDENIAELVHLGCYKIFEISGATTKGTRELIDYCGGLLERLPEQEIIDFGEYADGDNSLNDGELFTVSVAEDGAFEVHGRWIEQLIDSVNLADFESAQYFQRVLRQKGVIDKLLEAGIGEDDTVRISDTEFDFVN